MKALSSNAVATKAKAMYGKRLRKEDYQELLRKRSVNEVAAYLKNETAYSDILDGVRENAIHRSQLEHLLKKDLYLKSQRLANFAGVGHRQFYDYLIRLAEIDQILNCIHALEGIDREGYLASIPSYFEKRSRFDFLALAHVHRFDDLLHVLRGTGYDKIIAAFRPASSQDKIDSLGCERALRKEFYENLFDMIKHTYKGSLQRQLLEIFETSLELENMTKIYRLKKYFRADPQLILRSLIPVRSRLSGSFIEELVQAPTDKEMMRLLSESSYQFYVGDKDYVFIEYYASEIKYHLSERYMRFSTVAPLVYATYMSLHHIEIENIIHIIEGVRYHVAPESIEEVLIY